jgi:hypothetical protein
MGIMICETHGRVGFVETCSHIAKMLDAGRARRTVTTADFFWRDPTCVYATAATSRLNLKGFASLADLQLNEIANITDGRLEAFEEDHKAIKGRRGFCANCFVAIRRQDALV